MLVRMALILSLLTPAACFCASGLPIPRKSIRPADLPSHLRWSKHTHVSYVCALSRDNERGGALQVTSAGQGVPLLLDYGAAAATGVQRQTVGGKEVKVLLFSDQVVERAGAEGAAGRKADLTGLRVWPTNRPMLDKLQEQLLPRLRQQRPVGRRREPLRILELGSGCGLLGICMAVLGEHVVLTDPAVEIGVADGSGGVQTASTLEQLQANVELNQEVLGAGSASAVKLLWGEEADLRAVEQLGPFDAIVGCDVTYSPETFEALLCTIQHLTAKHDTPVFLGYNTLYVRYAAFLELAQKSFRVSTTNIGDGWTTTGAGGLYAQLAELRCEK